MKKVILLRIIGCVLFFSLVLFPANSTHYAEGSIFNGLFVEPCEISYVVFYDGYILKFTSYENIRINLSYAQFKEVLERKGRKVEDIAIKVHNHLPGGSYTFSDGDLRFMRRMREDGFKGSYCLKTPGGKIRYRRDENAALTQLLREKETKEFLKEYGEKYPEAYERLIDFMIKRVAK